MREDHQATCPIGRGAQQELVVGVAAHDAVQHHDVGGADGLWSPREVDAEDPVDAAPDAGLVDEPPRVRLVRARELEVRRVGSAAGEQRQLDLPDATADLEHGGTLDAR